MSSSVADPPEGFNYGGKYGWVYQETNTFDDMQDTFKDKAPFVRLTGIKDPFPLPYQKRQFVVHKSHLLKNG